MVHELCLCKRKSVGMSSLIRRTNEGAAKNPEEQELAPTVNLTPRLLLRNGQKAKEHPTGGSDSGYFPD
jgi:hypothetical protein